MLRQLLSVVVLAGMIVTSFVSSKYLALTNELSELKSTLQTQNGAAAGERENRHWFAGGVVQNEFTTSIQQSQGSVLASANQRTPFEEAVTDAFNATMKSEAIPKAEIDLKNWPVDSKGGLRPEDRIMVHKHYSRANSIFEFGLGESTLMASAIGVQRYSGIDSDSVWVSGVRDKVLKHFRFYFADLGKTKSWGFPFDKEIAKGVYNYQMAPLHSEPLAFDVYFVDGRYRIPSLLASVLHASARGSLSSTFLLHDCYAPNQEGEYAQENRRWRRERYHIIDEYMDLVGHSGARLCEYRRKENTTDQQILDLWHKTKWDLA